MKYTLFVITLLILCTNDLTAKNLKGFWGIPFGTSKANAEKMMLKKGATLSLDKGDDQIYNNVTFAGYDNCAVTIFFEYDGFLGAFVSITTLNESEVFNEYKKLKKLLSNKYPKTVPKSSESFTEPYSKGDGKEMEALRQQKADFITEWNFGNGLCIFLSVNHKAHINIMYVNAGVNKKAARREDKRHMKDL